MIKIVRLLPWLIWCSKLCIYLFLGFGRCVLRSTYENDEDCFEKTCNAPSLLGLGLTTCSLRGAKHYKVYESN
jgi:hypothetical protein